MAEDGRVEVPAPSGSVASLHLYPVKACRGIAVDTATIGRYGFVGDREWQIVNQFGDPVTQRQHPQLARVGVSLLPAGVRLTFDDRDSLDVGRPATVDTQAITPTGPVPVGDAGDAAAAWFSDVVGMPCRLVGIAKGYRRRFGPLLGDLETNLSDAAQIHLVTTASHRFLTERASEPFDIDRWRANVVVDTTEAWSEDQWRAVRVGDVVIDCTLPWPRCSVPQVNQHDGRRGREPAVVLAAHRRFRDLTNAPRWAHDLLRNQPVFGLAASSGAVGQHITVGAPVTALA